MNGTLVVLGEVPSPKFQVQLNKLLPGAELESVNILNSFSHKVSLETPNLAIGFTKNGLPALSVSSKML